MCSNQRCRRIDYKSLLIVLIYLLCHGKINASVENIDDLTGQFDTILGNVEKISDMCIQSATATEEQPSVAEEINSNINNTNKVGKHTVETSERALEGNQQLIHSVDGLQNTIDQFKSFSKILFFYFAGVAGEPICCSLRSLASWICFCLSVKRWRCSGVCLS